MKRLLRLLLFAVTVAVQAATAQSAAQSVAAQTPVQTPVRTVPLDCASLPSRQPVLVGMTDTAAYFPKLVGRRVAVLANHTAVARVCDFAPGATAGAATSLADRSAVEAACLAGASANVMAGLSGLSANGTPVCLPGQPADETVDLSGQSAAGMAHLPGASADGTIHLVDLLHGRGFDVTGIFSPEHGFRGTADAGELVKSSVDRRTGIPIRSLYDGNAKRPSNEAMQSFDVLVVDMQDVGLRFYTYYISMLRMMDACADAGRTVIILDRPNPNGHLTDGPILDMNYKSGVGALPIPVLHGLTMGEIARMAVGEGWAGKCRLEVVPCRNYTRNTPYDLPVAPSPNLPTQRAVYLYPSLCLFEGTVVSLGRGTDKPFEIYGHPAMTGYDFSFTPRPTAGAKHPPLEGRLCYGADLSTMPLDQARQVGLTLRYVIEAYRNLGLGEKFFTPMFEKLLGAGYVRRMIIAGASEAEIRACWQADLQRFCEQRRPYLLYAE